jgi:hypothetical protein
MARVFIPIQTKSYISNILIQHHSDVSFIPDYHDLYRDVDVSCMRVVGVHKPQLGTISLKANTKRIM